MGGGESPPRNLSPVLVHSPAFRFRGVLNASERPEKCHEFTWVFLSAGALATSHKTEIEVVFGSCS